MNFPADVAHLSGLEQMQMLFASKPDSESFGIGHTLGFDHFDVGEGWAEFGATPDRRVYNPIGSVHGGYAAALLDSAVGCAVHSALKPGQGYTTLELKVSYLRAMSEVTGPVRARGQVVQVGRRAAFAEGRLTDLEGRIFATATTTCLVFDLPTKARAG